MCSLAEIEETMVKVEKEDASSTKLDDSEVDDDDETVPHWFRQISSETIYTSVRVVFQLTTSKDLHVFL